MQSKKRIPLLYSLQNLPLLLLFLLLACGDKKEGQQKNAGPGQQAPQATSIDVVIVEGQPLEDKITSTGTLLANEEVEIRPEISGRIIGIYFDEGSSVKKGQILVKIDDSELKAQLKKLEIQNQLLKDRERRSKLLYQKEGISEEEYQTALSNYQTNSAEIDIVKSQIAKTRIVAPFDGLIGLRNASEGGFISNTGLIATLQQLDPIKLEFTVPEKSAMMIKEGTPVKYSVEGSDKVYQAAVYAIQSSVDVNTRTVRIRAKGANKENLLKPGAFAKVEIIVNTIENALLVPSEAVVPELGRQKVFVVKNGKVISAPVKVGIRTEREIEITEGLTQRDTVAVTGLMSLKDSAKINVRSVR